MLWGTINSVCEYLPYYFRYFDIALYYICTDSDRSSTSNKLGGFFSGNSAGDKDIKFSVFRSLEFLGG